MLIEAYAWGIISENYRRMQVTQLFFSVDYYDFTTSVLNLNRMRTEIIWCNIVHWNYMEERLFISGTSTCLLITSLFIRKLLAVAGSTCCMQSATTHNASSAPTHLDDESIMTSVVSNQKSEIVFQKGPDSSNPTTTSLKHMMIVFFFILKGESEMMVGWLSILWELACGRTPQLCRTNHIRSSKCKSYQDSRHQEKEKRVLPPLTATPIIVTFLWAEPQRGYTAANRLILMSTIQHSRTVNRGSLFMQTVNRNSQKKIS